MLTVTLHDDTPDGESLDFDVKDILRAIAARGTNSLWRCTNVECLGDNSNAVHIFSDYGALIETSSLIKLMDGIVQTINGSFAAYHLGENQPWLAIGAIDGGFFEVETRDDGVLPLLKARFRKIQDPRSGNWLKFEEDKARTPTGSLVLPEQWSRAAQAPMANALPAIETALRTIMREGKIISDNYTVFIVDEEKNYFIQAGAEELGEIGGHGQYGMSLEAVANDNIPPLHALEHSQEVHLVELGWKYAPHLGDYRMAVRVSTDQDYKNIARTIWYSLAIYSPNPEQVLSVKIHISGSSRTN
jgi:hypothetical protein